MGWRHILDDIAHKKPSRYKRAGPLFPPLPATPYLLAEPQSRSARGLPSEGCAP